MRLMTSVLSEMIIRPFDVSFTSVNSSHLCPLNAMNGYSMQSRGGQLQSALNSLAQLERAVEHFVAWLCDAETSLEVIEDDARRLPPREDVHRQLLQRIKVSYSIDFFTKFSMLQDAQHKV